MPRRFAEPREYFHLKRSLQISESHCGPATIQMLLSNIGIDVTQEQIADAGGATDLIELQGMRIDQLARAVVLLAPDTQFWYKEAATIDELVTLITEYQYPVGVEWQGIFEDEDEQEEADDDDYGHYSLISYIDKEKQELIIVDPYKDFVSRDRILTFDEFNERWWDYNEVIDLDTGKPKLMEDYHMLFIITPKNVGFPVQMGMVKA
jgi:hypothetical protein